MKSIMFCFGDHDSAMMDYKYDNMIRLPEFLRNSGDTT